MAGGIVLKASVLIRAKKGGRFPAGSYAAALSPARASLQRDTERAFDTQSDPVSGKPWPARKGVYVHPPLRKSGAMRDAAIQATAAAVVTGSSLTAKQTAPAYAGFQGKGTKTIAARRFLGASIGTIRIVQAGMLKAGKKQAVKVLRGR